MDRKIHNSYIPPWGMVVLHIGLECSPTPMYPREGYNYHITCYIPRQHHCTREIYMGNGLYTIYNFANNEYNMLVLVYLQFCSGLGHVQHVAEARGVLLVKVMVTWFPFHRLNIIIQLMLTHFYILTVCSFCEYIYSNTVLLSGTED